MNPYETNLYHAILITAVVIGSIIIFFIVSITAQQRKNLALQRLNILAEISALEKERGRIAHDLHDELGPLLSAVKMKINSFELTDQEDKVQMDKTNKHIDDVLKRIREISFDLMPSSLLRKGLVTALKEFVDYLGNHNKVTFTFNAQSEVLLDDEKSINVYRIVQEATHNAIKHAAATQIDIETRTDAKKLFLTIKDNGKGFDHKRQVVESTGFGLRGLLSRTEMMGGQMYLDSKPGSGTIYNFEIPLSR